MISLSLGSHFALSSLYLLFKAQRSGSLTRERVVGGIAIFKENENCLLKRDPTFGLGQISALSAKKRKGPTASDCQESASQFTHQTVTTQE